MSTNTKNDNKGYSFIIYCFIIQPEPPAKGTESAIDRLSYDEAEFLNSVKNGKNAVLSAAGQKSVSSTSAGILKYKYFRVFCLTFSIPL